MSVYGLGPLRFGTLSMVTTALGPNDPELGSKTSEGGRDYVLIYNSGGASMNVGHGVVPDSGVAGYSCTVTSVTSADFVIGVVRNATITTAAYGWVVTRGVTPVQMQALSGTVAAKGLLEIGADGFFAPVSLTTGNKAAAVGKALAEIVTSASGNAFIATYG